MEISAYGYMFMISFMKIFAVSSVAYIISHTDNNSDIDLGTKYFKIYFITALTVFILRSIADSFGLPVRYNILIAMYLIITTILIFALEPRYRSKFILYSSIFTAVAYLISSIYINYTDYQYLVAVCILSIPLYLLLLSISINKHIQFNNKGYLIMSFAFFTVVVTSVIGVIYLLKNDTSMSYTYVQAGVNLGFLLIAIGYLSVNLMMQYQSLSKLALTDPLTGINNRRGFYHVTESIIPSSNRANKCFSVVTIDIDLFKKVNDTYGHDTGDMVLKEFANILKSNSRNNDISARFGGEEFSILLPETDKENAIMVAEKLRKAIETTDIKIDDTTSINITASFGIATKCNEINIDSMMKEADKALYKAKFMGRNVVVHNDNR
ncbi:GGDEF domain-containing protein [Sulfurimonas sp.]|nr:GGDEF domain-containing protein [Sulfurimonas sp.]